MKKVIFINNKILPLSKASVSVLDRGLLYGDGVFETMRAYKGKVFKAREHLERLFTALRLLDLKIPYAKNRLEELIEMTLKRNNLADAYIRLTVTRGMAEIGINLPAKTKPTVIIYARPYKGLPAKLYKKGIKAGISCFRVNEYSPLSKIKSLNYLNNILVKELSRKQRFDDTIFTNSKNHVAEASTSNIFLVKNGKIFTPDIRSGILPGITRKVVINLARKYLNKTVNEKRISIKELLHADEVFLTNSMAEILPVVKIARTRIGTGAPGIYTAIIRAFYKEETAFLFF